jgi:hypothetical protein
MLDLYYGHRHELRDGELDVEAFLQKLNEEYVSGRVSENEEYMRDQGRAFLQQQRLRRMSQEVEALLDRGEIQMAQTTVDKQGALAHDMTYDWRDFTHEDLPKEAYLESEEDVFEFEGNLGRLIGPIENGWLTAVMGPIKRGKTWFLQEIAFEGIIQKRKVAFISLEMKDIHLSKRFYQHIGGFGKKDKAYTYPIFDCVHNQQNRCNKPQRTCKLSRPPKFDPSKTGGYRICSACRFDPDEKHNYAWAVWYESHFRPGVTLGKVLKRIKHFQTQYGDRLRIKSFPCFGATVSDIKASLEDLEHTEDFIPEIIIVDHADIIAPERNGSYRMERRHQIDFTWKRLKELAETREAKLFTATQADAGAMDAPLTRERNFSEDVRKLANVDILMALSQTEAEKTAQLIRLGILEHRWREFNRYRQLMILQQLEVGWPILDSEFVYYTAKEQAGDDDEE